MRFARFASVAFLSLISLPVFAGELKVQVVDPDQLAVAGARVALYEKNGSSVVAVQTTSGQGVAQFAHLADGGYRLEVLAPGFAAYKATVEVPQESEHTAQITLAGRSETVVVTAAGTPLPVEDGGAPAALLNAQALEGMRPVAASEARQRCSGIPCDNRLARDWPVRTSAG